MKNLKKVLALVVALTMVLGTVGFAAYTDVAEDANEYTAVSTLSSLSILTGYEDGSFKPDGDITRAEFATVVCRALGAKVSGSAVTGFTDVPADHWASAYIAYCAGAGIVNGMGDGTFAPSANVTVEQAVKMLVVALGYEPMAAAKGGYPTGYMVVANTNGITEGIAAAQTAAATRGAVAQLVYNALDVPMMVQDGFGTQVSYKVADGKGDLAYQSLLTGLDVAKLDGVVTGTPIMGTLTENGYVNFTITDNYDSEDFDGVADKDFAVAEGVNADDYFQTSSTVFVREYSKNKWEIIAIMPSADNTSTVFGIEDIDAIKDAGIDYYTSATKTDTNTLRFEPEANSGGVTVIYNNAPSTFSAFKALEGQTTRDIEITAMDNNGNNRVDVVIVKEYSYARVKTVTADKDRFTAGAYTFRFDFEDDNKSIKIVDKNGDAMELADFAENDVIAYMNDGSLSTYTWIEIINLGENAVTGMVGEVKDDAVYVDGTEYGIAGADVSLGDEGTFYLTRTGKIFDSEKSASAKGNFAYILAAKVVDSGFTSAWQIKMLTKENEIVTYTVRDNFQIDSAGTFAEDASGTFLDAIANSAANFKAPAEISSRLVTYTLDSKGLIREICTIPYLKAEENYSDIDATSAGSEYDADAQVLFTDLEDDVVIFNVDVASENSVFVTGASALVDGNDYKGYAVANEDGYAEVIVMVDGGSKIDFTQKVSVISNVTSIKVNEGADNAKKVTYYTANDEEKKEITIAQDPEISEAAGAYDYDDLVAGSLIMFTDDGNGTAVAYAILAVPAFTDSAAYTADTALLGEIVADDNTDITFVYGKYINDITPVSAGVRITDDAANTLVIKAETNAYTIDDRNSTKVRVYTGDWQAVDTVDTAAGQDDGKATYFFAIKDRNTVTDFVTFGTRK